MKRIDLSGSWRYCEDWEDCGIKNELYKTQLKNEGFILPGSACENGVGKRQKYCDEFTKEAVRAPREKYEYIAPLWLQREIEVAEDWTGKCIKLFLERVNIASELWIDGEKIGRQIIELSAPHIYNLTGKLTAGKHILTLRIDNRNLLDIDIMASGYSIDTQGYWNGIAGRMELLCEDIFHMENISVYPGENGIDVKLVAVSDVHSPFKRRNAKIELCVISPDGTMGRTKIYSSELFNSRQVEYLSYEMDNIRYWNEFDPALYKLNVKYSCGSVTDEKTVHFGMRTVRTENKQILLNNKPISLRGTTECAQYPLTGYPPTDIETWKKYFNTVKSYGLNYVRFHAWCPPENAFCAADMLGIYISVEMPLWLNHDVCALELGENPAHRSYYPQEALTISKTYGNHPSFIMFSNGNENMGDFELLEDITIQIKAYDNRRIYTLTSNFDHPVLTCEDYLCAYEAGGHSVRIQNAHDEVAKSTDFDFSKAVNAVNVPIVSFEIGQYCIYPNVDIADKYTGNMLGVNFDAIKKHMINKGVYHRLKDYIAASGDLALKLYKEDIESALRTKGFGGFGLLSLCDYTGQSTATVGLLDVFCESKGIIEAQDFKKFCNSVVPLFRAERIFKNTDIVRAKLDLYDYGEKRIEKPEFELKLYNGKNIIFEVRTEERYVEIPLHSVKKSVKIKVELSVSGYTNSWNIYVFADVDISEDVKVITEKSELVRIIEEGGRAVVSADCIKNPIKGSFIPVFWSPVHFPQQQKNPCGAIIDNTHPAFEFFPTDKYPDYQWKTLLDNSRAMDISNMDDEFRPIVEAVPNFVGNTPASPLFEVSIGNADLLFCGFDLSLEDTEVKSFKASLLKYVSSEKFKPAYRADKNCF